MPRLARLLPLVFAVPALAATARADFDPGEWKHRQPFEVTTPGLIKLDLPAETLDLARADRADLRVLSPAGRELPFALGESEATPVQQVEPQHWGVQQQARSTEISIVSGLSAPLDGLEISARRASFLKAARIETSADGETWRVVAEGLQLAPAAGTAWARLPLPNLPAARLRITLDDERTLPLAISGVRLTLAAQEPEGAPVPARIVRRDEFFQETVLTVDLGARHLPITELRLEVDAPLFSREILLTERTLQNREAAERSLAQGTIFRSPVAESGRTENLRIPVHATTSHREVQVRIRNGSSAPLAVRQVTARRASTWLIFQATEPGRHALLTGNGSAPAPDYDVRRLLPDLRSVPGSELTVHPAEATPGYRRPDALADSIDAGPVLDSRDWRFQKLVIHGTEPVQQVELDLAVLAHAQPSFRDLRLVRGGRQVPYLLERTSLLRPLSLTPVPADRPADPRFSRWTVTLPHPRLPLERLTLDSPAVLFSREVRVFEEVTDRRGEKHEQALAATTRWNRSPTGRNSPLTINFITAPTADALVIEVANGDNAPITLRSVEAAYVTTRLLFRTDEEPLFLLYGASEAAAPHYDLELVADQLMASDRGEARLGSEELLAPENARTAGRGGPLLWISLSVVVLVLLVAIGRLLPKA